MRFRFGFMGMAWFYLALAALYAVNTPQWQVPDEPAHYNYIRTIAEQAALPVLQVGDYDQTYLEKIKSGKFPPELSIDSIRYESHQPPIYYLIAAPFYKIGESAPTAVRLYGLRLFSTLWGVVLLAIIHRIATLLFPSDPLTPLLAIALVAFVPQHLAMEGGVNNDALAEVVLAGVVFGLVIIMLRAQKRNTGDQGKLGDIGTDRLWLAVGFLIGLGFVTKTTTYVSVGLVTVTLFMLWRKSQIANHKLPDAIRQPQSAILALLIALLIGSLWFARDAITYGPTDWLGLVRHNAVVVGQPRMLELYPNYLVAATNYFPTLFRSFWGQFGWMSVVLDARTYNALFVFSVFALLGLVFYVRRPLTADRTLSAVCRPPSAVFILLAAWFLFTLVSTVAYSLEFYQAQGRYLFPALGAIAIFMAMGLRQWMRLAAQAMARIGVSRAVTEWALFGMFVAAFVVLDWVCLYRYVVPGLK